MSHHAIIVLDVFQILAARHAIFGMPMLARETTTCVIIPSTVRICDLCLIHLLEWIQGIEFPYNVQHDCPLVKCTASGEQPLMQERVESGLIKKYIEHQSIERFVINSHAFHNAHLLRANLPRSLVAPIPIHQDRQARHFEIATSLRATQEAKRTATKARAAQKKKKSADEQGPSSSKRPRLEMEEADLDSANISGG